MLLITSSITYQLPYGASVAASVRVGNLIGLSRMMEAKIAGKTALQLAGVIGVLNSMLLFVVRNHWGHLFSSDADVIALVASVMPIMALFQCADCVCGIAAGILRGCGRQGLGAAINVSAYYVIGIPTSLFLAFGPPQMGLHGLWWGLTIALVYGSCLMIWFISRINWHDVIDRINRTMAESPDAATC